MQCGHESNTHQAFLDLSLDIRREKSVRNALQVNACSVWQAALSVASPGQILAASL